MLPASLLATACLLARAILPSLTAAVAPSLAGAGWRVEGRAAVQGACRPPRGAPAAGEVQEVSDTLSTGWLLGAEAQHWLPAGRSTITCCCTTQWLLLKDNMQCHMHLLTTNAAASVRAEACSCCLTCAGTQGSFQLSCACARSTHMPCQSLRSTWHACMHACMHAWPPKTAVAPYAAARHWQQQQQQQQQQRDTGRLSCTCCCPPACLQPGRPCEGPRGGAGQWGHGAGA